MNLLSHILFHQIYHPLEIEEVEININSSSRSAEKIIAISWIVHNWLYENKPIIFSSNQEITSPSHQPHIKIVKINNFISLVETYLKNGSKDERLYQLIQIIFLRNVMVANARKIPNLTNTGKEAIFKIPGSQESITIPFDSYWNYERIERHIWRGSFIHVKQKIQNDDTIYCLLRLYSSDKRKSTLLRQDREEIVELIQSYAMLQRNIYTNVFIVMGHQKLLESVVSLLKEDIKQLQEKVDEFISN